MLPAVVASHQPEPLAPAVEALPNSVLLKKLRADYPEFEVYTPISANGINWMRWWVTNRLNTGNSGSPRVIRASLCYLYLGAPQAPHAANSTGTEGQAPSTTQATSAATARVGTWTADTTVSGISGIRYSTVTDDYVEYTITGVSRIVARGVGVGANGAIAAVLISAASVEIDAGLYLTESTKRISYAIQAGLNHIPLAEGLNPATTYTVRLTRHSSSQAGGRLYDGGIYGYAAIAFNAVGRHGVYYTQALGSPAVDTRVCVFSGVRSVYQLDNATRVLWRAVTNVTGGIQRFVVYDAAGAEIDAGKYTVTTFDGYAATNNPISVQVADGLTKGTYYLHVIATPTKNASATAYRQIDYGANGVDTTLAGVVGSDSFDVGTSLNATTQDGNRGLIGDGNLEAAIKASKTSEAVGAADFCGGTHGHESAPASLVYKVSGSVIDFAGAAAGATWTGTSAELSFSTSLLYPSDSAPFATTTCAMRFDRGGYSVDNSRTLTADANVWEDYAMLFNVPDITATDGFAGGFRTLTVGPSGATYDVNAQNDGQTNIALATWCVWSNASAAVSVRQKNWSGILSACSQFGGNRTHTLIQDRADNRGKVYNRAWPGTEAAFVAVPAGHSYTSRKNFRGWLK